MDKSSAPEPVCEGNSVKDDMHGFDDSGLTCDNHDLIGLLQVKEIRWHAPDHFSVWIV